MITPERIRDALAAHVQWSPLWLHGSALTSPETARDVDLIALVAPDVLLKMRPKIVRDLGFNLHVMPPSRVRGFSRFRDRARPFFQLAPDFGVRIDVVPSQFTLALLGFTL